MRYAGFVIACLWLGLGIGALLGHESEIAVVCFAVSSVHTRLGVSW